MRFLRIIFMNKEEECAWLRDTALKALDAPPFGSFQIHGNEDSPARVELFSMVNPAYNTKPSMVYELNAEGDLAVWVAPPPAPPPPVTESQPA